MVERALLGICAAVIAVAVPLGIAHAARTREAVRHWRLAEEFVHQREWLEAEVEFRASLSVDPTFFPSREALVSISWAREDYDACFRELKEAHRVDPRSPEPLIALGRIHFNRRDFAAAIQALEQAVALAPSHHYARKLLATCRSGAGGQPDLPCAACAAHEAHAHSH